MLSSQASRVTGSQDVSAPPNSVCLQGDFSVLSPILLRASHYPFFHGEPWAFSCTGIAIWNAFLLLQCQVLREGCLQALPALFSLNSHLFPSWPGSVLCGGVQGTKPPVTLTSQSLRKDNEGSLYHPHFWRLGCLSSLLPIDFRACYREGTQLTKWLWGRNVTDNTLGTVGKREPLQEAGGLYTGCSPGWG